MMASPQALTCIFVLLALFISLVSVRSLVGVLSKFNRFHQVGDDDALFVRLEGEG